MPWLRGVLGMMGMNTGFSTPGAAGGAPMGASTKTELTQDERNQNYEKNINRLQIAKEKGYDTGAGAALLAGGMPDLQMRTQSNDIGTQPATAVSPDVSSRKSIWDKLSDFDQEYTKKVQDRGYMAKPQSASAPETPWSVSDLPDDQWHNREMGIMFDPNDPEMKDKMMQAAMNEGKLDPERYQQISRYQSDVSNNPYYQSQRDRYYKDKFGVNKFDSWLGKLLGAGDKNINLKGN